LFRAERVMRIMAPIMTTKMRITGFTVWTFLRTAGVEVGLGFGMCVPIHRKGRARRRSLSAGSPW
jgi:hypothetical protein